MRVFERVIESFGAPGKHDLWIKPADGGYEVKAWDGQKWAGVGGGSGSGSEMGGSKVVKLVANSDESAWLNSLADLVEVVASGEYEGGIYVSEPNNPNGVRYSPIAGCEYFVGNNGSVKYQTSDSSGTIYSDYVYDSPDVLRWLSTVGEEMCEVAGGYFVRNERLVTFMQMSDGTAMSVNLTNDNDDSISLYVCDDDRHPYLFDISDGIITGVGLFDIVAPEEASYVCLSHDKVNPLVGKSTTISGNTPSIPGPIENDNNTGK